MSTRALLAVYVNGEHKKTYFHHWDGYLSHLGNILITFKNIVHHQLNNMDDELFRASQKKRNSVIGARSPIDLLQPLLDADEGFCEEPNFNDYWCLEYIYRINFVFCPKEDTFKWKVTLDYTKDISQIAEKWTKPGYISLVNYEGVHYKGENPPYIDPKLKKHYETLEI